MTRTLLKSSAYQSWGWRPQVLRSVVPRLGAQGVTLCARRTSGRRQGGTQYFSRVRCFDP